MNLRLMLGLLSAMGVVACAHPARLDGFSSEDDEAHAWNRRYRAFAEAQAPADRKERAAIAFEGLTTGMSRRFMDDAALRQSGASDAEAAVKGLDADPEAWDLLARYRARYGADLAGAAQASCRAAGLVPKSADRLEKCGDALRAAGEGTKAVERFRQALGFSADREQQLELVEKIDRTSLNPADDLASLPGNLVEEYLRGRGARR